jgi:hypothetical protein
MPRTLLTAAAVATAAPLAVGTALLLSPGTSSPAVRAITATPNVTAAALVATRSYASALALSSPAARAVIAATPVTPSTAVATRLTAARLNTHLILPPMFQLPIDARRRADSFLDAVATGQDPAHGGILPDMGRSVSSSIAWMDRGFRNTKNEAFGPTPVQWVKDRIEEACQHLAARTDDHPPDFDAADLVRLMYLFPPAPYVLATPTVGGVASTTTRSTLLTRASAVRLSALISAITPPPPPPAGGLKQLPRDLAAKITTALKGFKWWVDQPGKDDMVYWSENHQILFASSEYLAGQLMPNEWFAATGMYGRDHKARGRQRALKWLDEHHKFGMSEWNSPGYYQEDFKALFNLADFADDPMVKKKATMMLDLLIFDLARYTQNGSFGVTSGRCYEKVGGDGSKWKSDGWRQSVGELIQVLFATRGQHLGTEACAIYYATSKYEVPPVLLAIGQDKPDHFVDRSRVSLDFDEGKDWGIGFNGLEDCMFWWSKSAYMAKQNIANTRRVIRQYDVHRLGNDIKDALSIASGAWDIASDGQLYAAADAASPITEGMCLTKANLYTYRNRDVMLSSVQDYRRGQIGPQQQVWQATLGMKAVVFTSLPGKRESDGPGYWTGNAAMPSAIQHENAMILAYDAPLITQLKEGLHRTHAWFPKAEFDEFDRRRGSNLHGAWGVTSKGTWIFGRKGNGYVALYSNEGYDSDGPIDFTSTGSWTNVYVCQVGNAAEFGDFNNFKNQCTSARIYIHYPHVGDWSPVYCGYDIPGKGRLELHYGGAPVLNGRAFDVKEFPRYDNPYTYVPWGNGSLGIRHAGMSLIHLRDTVNPQTPRLDARIVDNKTTP